MTYSVQIVKKKLELGEELSMDLKPWDMAKEIHSRYIGDICVERPWKDWLVYLETINFLDKKYEKYYDRPGNERIFRQGLQWDY